MTFARPGRVLCAAALAVFVSGLAAACGEDGSTPVDCRDLPRYNVKEFDGSNPAIKAAADKGCVTPAGTATSVRDAAPG